jgi:hypothetical protein
MQLRLSLFTAASLAVAALAAPALADFSPINLVVSRYGDGSTTLGSAAAAAAIQEYSKAGALVQTINFPGSGANQVTDSGSATSNGYLKSYNGFIAMSGYNSAVGTASVASSNTKVGTVLDGSGSVASRNLFPTSGSPLPFTGNNFRSMIATSANTFYATGAGNSGTGGAWYYNGSSYTQLSTDVTNLRTVGIFGGQLYASSSSGSFLGITKIGNGLSTTGGQSTTVAINTGTGSSSYGFTMFDTNNDNVLDLAYIADDRSTTGGGLQKWVFNGTTWTNSWSLLVNNSLNTLSATTASGFAGLRGLTGTWDAVNGAQLFATTTEGSNNRLISITDTGLTPTTYSTLASAGANYVFRGVDLSVPAPGAFALLGLAGLIARRRR